MKKHLIVVGALFQEGNKILLCQRKNDDAYGGLWEFPGGKLERDETKQQAVAREMLEELGVVCEVGELVGEFSDENETLHIDISLYKIISYKNNLQCIECQDYRWVTKQEANAFNLAPADIKILRFLNDM